jgi:hypothetical protein
MFVSNRIAVYGCVEIASVPFINGVVATLKTAQFRVVNLP